MSTLLMKYYINLLSRKRADADSSGIGFDDAEDVAHHLRRNAQPGADAADAAVARSHVGICS